MWKPGSFKVRTVIRAGLWSGLITWMACSLILSVLFAIRFYRFGPGLFGGGTKGEIFGHWVGPFWIVFTTAMLVWAVARFTVRKFRRQDNGVQ